jgi:diguanylate cyclase (GGDEF)-like protein/PAS domain S-box-containing protein
VRRGPGAFRHLVQNAPDVVMLVESDSSIRYVNNSVSRMFGYRPEELVGQKLDRYLCPSDRDAEAPNATPARGDLRQAPGALAFRMRTADGSWRRVEAVVVDARRSARSGSQRIYYIRDASQDDAKRRELERCAFEDTLTGLANRNLFMNRLKHALSGRARHKRPVAVLFLDLDDFKAVNDRLGHGTGDRLLVAMGQRLRACVRPEDTAARLGGDEFTVLVEDAAGAAPIRLAERLLGVMEEPVALDGRKLNVSLSIGVAVSDADHGDADSLLHAADAAMYRAKQAGKGRYAVSEAGALERAPRRFDLENDLLRAVERSEFGVCYRPVVSLNTGSVVSMEALLGWEHPELGYLPAGAFVPTAERNGLMIPIGRWLLKEACEQASEWQDLGPAAPATVTVDLSARQLGQTTIAEQVADVLQETGFAPDELILGIPERVLAVGHRVAGNLQKLRALNVKLTLRDFGTGSTTLPDMVRLPVRALKIDRSLIGALRDGPEGTEPLVASILRVAGALGLATVAEGIDDPEQATVLREMGCDAGQGPYFSGPLQRDAATRFLEASSWDAGENGLRVIHTEDGLGGIGDMQRSGSVR